MRKNSFFAIVTIMLRASNATMVKLAKSDVEGCIDYVAV